VKTFKIKKEKKILQSEIKINLLTRTPLKEMGKYKQNSTAFIENDLS
jgi:hypothetical protein